METFEIHITGSHGINAELDNLGIKNIIVDLLKPDETFLRREYMSSFISKHENIAACKNYVDDILKRLKTSVLRVKIETPFYKHYAGQSLYLESHFKPFNNVYPISKNVKSGKLMATDRTYDKSQYNAFIEKWKTEDVELCLVDSFIEEDLDWFNLYQK